jgi:hypothetical protein
MFYLQCHGDAEGTDLPDDSSKHTKRKVLIKTTCIHSCGHFLGYEKLYLLSFPKCHYVYIEVNEYI